MKKGDFQRLAVNPPAYANYFGQPRVLLGTLGIVELNINGFPFPGWSTVEKSRQVAHIILPVLNKLKGVNWSFQLEMSELDSIQRRFLLERMQITYAMAARNEACHVLINDKQDMEAYVNDEEELLILRFFPGEEDSISRAEDTCRKLRDELTELLPVARHPKFGYLSACPEKTGSGLWYSFLLHTPAMQILNGNRQLQTELEQLVPMDPQPLFPRGNGAHAGLYWLHTYTISFGTAARTTMEKLHIAVNDIIALERRARTRLLMEPKKRQKFLALLEKMLMKTERGEVKTFNASLEALSALQLGHELGLLQARRAKASTAKLFSAAYFDIAPTSLALKQKLLSPRRRHEARIDYLRKLVHEKLELQPTFRQQKS